MKKPLARFLVAPAICLALTSCSRGPSAIPFLKLNASSASERALKLYDQDANGALDQNELNSSPGLRAALKRMDKNGNDAFDQSEIIEMIDGWNDKPAGLISLRCRVLRRNRLLEGAEIRFIPDEFLADEIQMADGITDEYGETMISIPPELRKPADSPPGLRFGIYRVEISLMKDGRETIAAKYNSASELGQEVSYDDPGVQNGAGITFAVR